jgi:Sulfotransferase domain
VSGVLPNLLVAGVPKGGTGSLFGYFGQHPDVCASAVKEVGYFTPLRRPNGRLGSVESYKRNFSHWCGERYAMEATPNYCYGGARVRAGIRQALGEPRIVISLRDPVERLWSAYTMQRTKGNLLGLGSFEGYVSACEEVRRHGEAARELAGLSVGMYGDYIPGWLEEFGEDVRVVFLDDLDTDPRGVVGDLCRWLSIDDRVADTFDYDVRNATAHARSPALGRAVFAAKARADGALARAPGLRRQLRKTYVRLATAPLSETMASAARERVGALYRDSNASTAAALREHGYRDLPSWLNGN